jgi:small multidrug resistance family-3 protein
MALFWGWIFEAATPDLFDIIGAVIALVGVMIIFYMPRKKGKLPLAFCS